MGGHRRMASTRRGEPKPLQTNFLRKGQGNGGSSTKFTMGMVDPGSGRSRRISNQSPSAGEYSPEKGQILIPMLRQEKTTTVRIRTKNNSFIYGQDSIGSSSKRLPMMSSTQNTSPRADESQSMLWEMRRQKQEQIQKYKEYKLQK